MTPRLLLRIAVAALVALIALSIAFVVASSAAGTSPGYVLAAVKVVVLGFLLRRVVRAHAYTLQWSSMLILLFMAEGTVRAMSDPQPGATYGVLEAVVATAYFWAVLQYLRPLKKAVAKERR